MMCVMNFSETISGAIVQLIEEWRKADDHWRDRTATYFEETHLQGLIDEANIYLNALENLEQVFQEVAAVAQVR